MKLSSKLKRVWVTPFVTGSFLLIAVTGILMFFHASTKWGKLAHEWLGWAMVIAVLFHIIVNFAAFKNMFKSKQGKIIVAFFAVILGLSFFNLDGSKKNQPAFVVPMKLLASASVSELAQISHIDEQILLNRLKSAGMSSATTNSSVKQLVGEDFGKQMQTLNTILKEAP